MLNHNNSNEKNKLPPKAFASTFQGSMNNAEPPAEREQNSSVAKKMQVQIKNASIPNGMGNKMRGQSIMDLPNSYQS